ncbi:hypothetical protein [Neotabrizicola shimadae]|uniref:Uncharacterized protein n=1 Tax=Neotabrizicola shimadae TaxID=2807096 RepID=A0A8G0ZXE7_9RHOB|nr:hypothetical protein [Neotabrizicola shimadae]QYZ70470.1 hypothetical protein JO391_02795 [Neotabrizicola shimadae]
MSGKRAPWQEVLYAVITDALKRAPATPLDAEAKRECSEIMRARDDFLRPNRDFNIVCAFAGLDPEAARDRLRRRIAQADARSAWKAAKHGPSRAPTMVTACGETMPLSESARIAGISRSTIYQRIRVKGMDAEDALTAPT